MEEIFFRVLKRREVYLHEYIFLHRYQEEGVEGLYARPKSGWFPKDLRARKMVEEIVTTSPDAFGSVRSCWSVGRLRACLNAGSLRHSGSGCGSADRPS
jgi:hypothetical protein